MPYFYSKALFILTAHDHEYIGIKEVLTQVYMSACDLIQAPVSIRDVFISSIDYVFYNGGIEFSENKLHAIVTIIKKIAQYISENIPEEYNNQEGKEWISKFDRAIISLQLNDDRVDEQDKAVFAQFVDDYIVDLQFIMQDAISKEDRHNLYTIQEYVQKRINQRKKEPLQENVRTSSANRQAPKPNVEVKFKHILKDVQREKITEYLSRNQYTLQAKELVSFLCGENPIREITIASNRLTDMCYLLSVLHKERLIAMSGKRGYIQHFVCHVCLLDSKLANWQVELEARKYKRRKNVNRNPAKSIDNFVNSLITFKK